MGSVRVDQRFVLDSELPVGEYHRSSGLNLSSHDFTVHPYYAVTIFPGKRIESSWRLSYLWNSANRAPPKVTAASSTRAGQAIHFNATASYMLGHGVWFGANAYYLKQITAPQVNGIALPNSPEQVSAIGPGMVWNRGKYFFYVNGYHEFAVENRSEGNELVLRVQRIFGKPPRPGQ